MVVSSTEVQSDFGKYVELASEHEIIITQDGPYLSDCLVGLVPVDVNEDLLKAERVMS